MIPQAYRDNFNTLIRAFGDSDACLLECHEKATGKPVYVICAVNRRGQAHELVPFARLFDDNPYELLVPPSELSDPSTGKEPRP
jgi:hypothetical protein